jgi:hypothetical protein
MRILAAVRRAAGTMRTAGAAGTRAEVQQ